MGKATNFSRVSPLCEPLALDNDLTFYSWHQDIKPNNILVSGDIVNKPYEARFMLADLGLSHFAAVVEDKADLTGEDQAGSQAYSIPITQY